MSGMNTRLISKPLSNMADAALVMGQYDIRGNEKYTCMILEPSRSSCSLWITIPEGFHALVTSYGRYIGIWDSGFHVARPWERVSHLVTQQYVVYDTPVKECPTMDNVMVEIDVSTVFHLRDTEEDVKNFVFSLGPTRLEQMLNAYQEEAVRSMARQKKYSTIYDLMDTEELNLPKKDVDGPVAGTVPSESVDMPGAAIEMTGRKGSDGYGKLAEQKVSGDLNGDGVEDVNEQLENTKRSMNERLKAYGVVVYSITITNVHLPQQFRAQMEEATTFESKNIRAAAEQKFSVLVIEDQEKRNQATQLLLEEKQEAVSKNEQRMANELKVTQLYQAGTQALVADIEQKMKADVLELRTNSELKVSQLQKAKEVELATLEAEGVAEARRVTAEMNAFVMNQRANAKSKVAENDATSLQLQSEAEAVAAPKLKAKRDFVAQMAQLRVVKNMASNSDLVVSGNSKDNVVAQLMANQNSGAVLGLNAN